MRATLCFLALAVAVGVACGDSTGPEDVAGIYTLQTVDGSGPPWFTMVSNRLGSLDGEQVFYEMRLEWISGSLRLNRDATFSETFVVRETLLAISTTTGEIVLDSTTTIPQTQVGTFTVTRRTIQLTDSDGTVYSGSLAGNVLTMIVGGVAWVYER